MGNNALHEAGISQINNPQSNPQTTPFNLELRKRKKNNNKNNIHGLGTVDVQDETSMIMAISQSIHQ
jgi:16S rRNA C967 or C1407 C5-methylase (RsmB/RsmF family)